MRKLLWCCAIVVLLGGIYLTVGHCQIHPDSPVGRCLAWFGGKPKVTSNECLTELIESDCDLRKLPRPIIVEAMKPAGFISVEPDFPLMGDPDGNNPVVPVSPGAGSEPVREVVVPSEEVRLMPGVEDEPAATPERKPQGEITLGVELNCPFKLICEIKCDGCKMCPLACLHKMLVGKATGSCPFACLWHKKPEVIAEMPVEVKPEPIVEPPVEIEESEPASPSKSLGWFRWSRFLPRPAVDTMEARPSDLTPSQGPAGAY
jgi:hypothetical protein